MKDFSEDHEAMSMCQDCGCARGEHTGTDAHPTACGLCSCNKFVDSAPGTPIIPTVEAVLSKPLPSAPPSIAVDLAQPTIAPVVQMLPKPKGFAPGGLVSAMNAGQTKRAEILAHAAALVDGPRNAEYGDPVENHERIAALWSEVLGINVTAEQAALCLVQLKISRLVQNPRHADSWLDICGYGAIGGEIADTHDRADDVPPLP